MRVEVELRCLCDGCWVEDMGRQESPQLVERKGQVDTDAQDTSRACKYILTNILCIVLWN